MTDPISAVGAGLPASNASHAAHAAHAAHATPAAHSAAVAPGGGLRAVAATLGDLGGRLLDPTAANPASMLARAEHAALSSLHPQDYLRATLVATDVSVHVSTSLMKFHLSSSLANAATGLFNTLLKNRE